MLILENPTSAINGFTDIRFWHDPSLIEFKNWLALSFLEGRTLPTTNQQRTTLSLGHQQNAKVTQVEIHSTLALQNHSSSPLLNISIYCRQSGENIFSISKLPSNKTIQFKFIKPGSYNICYFLARMQKSVERWINVPAKLPSISSTSYNFNAKLKPS